MELDSESKYKQLVELQELYKSEQQLTAELGDKLDKTEKKLQETEHALADLEERYRQANATIKEKEYLISNLLKSCTIAHALEKTKYPNSAIYWKKFEKKYHFSCQFTANLLAMNIYWKGVVELLFRGIASEADTLLNDLQNNLHTQENKLNAFAEQQWQAYSRAVTTTRSISQITVNFFKTLDLHLSKFGQIVEEVQSVNDQKLSDFKKKFEECAANEEIQLLEKVAELLASSNARKKVYILLYIYNCIIIWVLDVLLPNIRWYDRPRIKFEKLD